MDLRQGRGIEPRQPPVSPSRSREGYSGPLRPAEPLGRCPRLSKARHIRHVCVHPPGPGPSTGPPGPGRACHVTGRTAMASMSSRAQGLRPRRPAVPTMHTGCNSGVALLERGMRNHVMPSTLKALLPCRNTCQGQRSLNGLSGPEGKSLQGTYTASAT